VLLETNFRLPEDPVADAIAVAREAEHTCADT
jgi:hypothetical protein